MGKIFEYSIIALATFMATATFFVYVNESVDRRARSMTTHQESSNNYAVVNFPDGTKVPMIQLPDGSYTNLSQFYNAQREKSGERVSVEERDITKKLVGEVGR